MLGDRDRLAVALDALLENAVAHTEPGDRIELSARLQDGQVVLAVEDAGCGIGEGDLERIFGRFARARPYRRRTECEHCHDHRPPHARRRRVRLAL